MRRISKDEYYLEIAKTVFKRSTCLKRQYGVVIVKNDEIISTGYNGSPRETKNCCDHYDICPRMDVRHNSGHYDDCQSVHAEQNAMLSASRRDMLNATIYIIGFESDGSEIQDAQPCPICRRMILNAGIRQIITQKDGKPLHTVLKIQKK